MRACLFAADGMLVVYSDRTLVEFVQGYSMVLNCEMDTMVKTQMSQHLEELTEDMDLYRWNRVCAYHAAWLNQLLGQKLLE